MVKLKKAKGVQIRARGPCPILCDVHTPESPSQRPMGTAIRGFNLSGMNQPVPARIQGVSGSGIPGHLDPPMQGAERIPESSAEGNGDSTSLPASPCPRPWKKRSPAHGGGGGRNEPASRGSGESGLPGFDESRLRGFEEADGRRAHVTLPG